jgi:hypothetical protein
MFAEDVSIADFHRACDTGVGQILRLVADYRARMKHVIGAEFRGAENRDVTDQAGARTETNFSIEEAQRTNLDAGGQLDLGAYHRTRMNPRRRVMGQLRSLRFFRSS